jgi:hypothetical protein
MSDPVAALDGFFVTLPGALESGDLSVKRAIGITIAKGTPLSESLEAMLVAGCDRTTVESLSNPSALAKAKHSLRHAESGKFVSGSPQGTATGSGGATPSAQSSASPLTPDPRSTFPSEDMHDSLPGSAKPRIDVVAYEQGGAQTLWAHGGAVLPYLRKLRRSES